MTQIQGEYDVRFAAVAHALGDALEAGDARGSAAVFVVTKTMTALCALILVDRGLLDPDAPVARYWPEFAAAGKESVLVRHVLAHTAGLPDWDGPVVELYDWAAATRRLASTAPQWEPG